MGSRRLSSLTFCPLSALASLKKAEILGALIAQEIEAESGLIRLARAELAEHLGLLPIGIGAGDLAGIVDRLADGIDIAREQQRIQAQPHRHLIHQPRRHHGKERGGIPRQPQGSEAVGARGEEIDAGSLARRRLGIGQQQPALEIAHRRRDQCRRQSRQELLDQNAVGILPHVHGEAAGPLLQGSGIVRRHIAEIADLLRAGARGIAAGRRRGWQGQRLDRDAARTRASPRGGGGRRRLRLGRGRETEEQAAEDGANSIIYHWGPLPPYAWSVPGSGRTPDMWRLQCR